MSGVSVASVCCVVVWLFRCGSAFVSMIGCWFDCDCGFCCWLVGFGGWVSLLTCLFCWFSFCGVGLLCGCRLFVGLLVM